MKEILKKLKDLDSWVMTHPGLLLFIFGLTIILSIISLTLRFPEELRGGAMNRLDRISSDLTNYYNESNRWSIKRGMELDKYKRECDEKYKELKLMVVKELKNEDF